MRRAAIVRFSAVLVLVLGLTAALASAQERIPQDGVPPVPVVLALDTSRSLSPAQLEAATERLALLVQDLSPGTPVGVVVFADDPHWLSPVGTPRDEILRSLRGLQPEGQFTLLNDALYVAAGELDMGGVIILATDGKDENSATTVEDVARHCQSSGVTVLTVGTGSVVQEKPLRRLALLTDGQHLGSLDGLEPGRLESQVLEATAAAHQEQVRRLTERQRPQPPPEEPASSMEDPGAEAATVPAQAQEESGGSMAFLFLAAAGTLLLLGALFYWLWNRGRQDRESYCSRCGSELEAGASCARCEGERLRDELEEREVLTPDEVVEVPQDRELGTETVDENTRPVTLEATRVLEQKNVLVLREPGTPPRSFFLPQDKAFGLGRDPSVNSISLADPAMSSRHLKIVPEAGEFYVVDLRSTNGSSVNGSRVAAQILRPGDLIRAGQVELEFRSHLEAHN